MDKLNKHVDQKKTLVGYTGLFFAIFFFAALFVGGYSSFYLLRTAIAGYIIFGISAVFIYLNMKKRILWAHLLLLGYTVMNLVFAALNIWGGDSARELVAIESRMCAGCEWWVVSLTQVVFVGADRVFLIFALFFAAIACAGIAWRFFDMKKPITFSLDWWFLKFSLWVNSLYSLGIIFYFIIWQTFVDSPKYGSILFLLFSFLFFLVWYGRRNVKRKIEMPTA
ncbi:MAG: hypothetical protein WC878_03205 [Candidatus Paceibacterota bacterium]|jgi:hypothetical protein